MTSIRAVSRRFWQPQICRPYRRVALAALLLLFGVSVAAQTTYNSPTGLNLVFVDDGYNGTLASMTCHSINVPAAGTVEEVSVRIGMSHTWVGDLVIKLLSPVNTTATLVSRPGVTESADDGNNFVGAGDSSNLAIAFPIDYVQTASIASEDMGNTLNTSGVICENDGQCSFRPTRGAAVTTSENLQTAFDGESQFGDWQLCIGDANRLDIGSLDRWSLTVTAAPVQADLSITKTDGVTSVVAGSNTTYSITASNAGPDSAPGATVADTFPVVCDSVNWTCAGAGGGTCTASGSGNISQAVNLPSGGSVTFSAICAISGTATGSFSNSATVAPPLGGTDPDLGNNIATDTNALNIPPTMVSINRANASPTNATSVPYTVTFSESVTGVGIGNFTPVMAGVSGATVTGASGSGTTWTVTVNSGAGSGTLGLDMTNSSGVTDSGGAGVSNLPFIGQLYVIDKTPPTVTINQASGQADPTSGSLINFTAVFSEAVTGLLGSEINITGTSGGTKIATVTEIAPNNGTTYNVAVSGMTTGGTVIAAVAANAAQDAAGNNSAASTSSDNTVTYRVVCPTAFTVGNNGDGADALPGDGMCATSGGACTLRAATQEANTLATCSPLTINVNATGAINLPAGQLTISHPNLSIVGPGASALTLRNTQAPSTTSRVLVVLSGATANISGLTFTGGQPNGDGLGCFGQTCGGGIFNAGSLTLTECVITGNSPSGITSLGGGIFTRGSLTLVNSTVSNNSISVGGSQNIGGGIAVIDGTVNLLQSTVSGNTASGGGSDNFGGGIYSQGGTLRLTNSTISGNSVSGGFFADGGGIAGNGGTITATNCTIAGNAASDGDQSTQGGGVFGNLTARNTVIAGNTVSGNNSQGPDVRGTLTSRGQNLLSNNANTTITPTIGDQIGTPASPINPLLAPLGNYGGPTQTHALLPGSPAINAGNNCVLTVNGCGASDPTSALTTDQRGIARVGTVDIGAFESRGFALTPTSGNAQTTLFNTAFALPLVTTVSSAFSEPVQGGVVSYVAPGSGASAALGSASATIAANGEASTTATANGTTGSYSVIANANGNLGNELNFALTNRDLSADLSISKTDGTSTEIPGTSVTYMIVASNAGPDPVTGATVADTFPAVCSGATWTCVGAGGGACTANGSGNINDSVNLPVGGSATYTATCSISAAATGNLVNTATVSSGISDPTPSNNSATDTNTLIPQADLSITKTDGVTTVNAGSNTIYAITASNAGPSNASATVTDTFPAACASVNWTCSGTSGGTCPGSGSGNINEAVNLRAGSSVAFAATCAISASATGTLSNTASVLSAANDPTPGNNSAIDSSTIIPVPVVSIAGQSITEGDSGTSNLQFTVSRTTNGTAFDVTVATSDGGAVAVEDYNTISTTVSFTANGAMSQTVNVPIVGDNRVEVSESFTATLSNPTNSAQLGTASATGTITDNDSATVQFAPTSVSQSEGTTPMPFTVTLSSPVQSGVTLAVNSTPGSAASPADFTAISGTVTFEPNSNAAQTVNVTIAGDALDEDDEQFTLTLSGLTATGNVTLPTGTATATGTIQDDDATPTLSVANVTQPEGNASNTLTFTATLSAISGRAVTFTRATQDGSAVSTGPNADFVALSAAGVTIPAGTQSVPIAVTINGDTNFEGDQSFALSVTSIVNTTPGSLTATATLTDDDQQPTTTTITSDLPDPSLVGQPYTVNVTVSGQATSPGGTIAVSDGSASCGPVNLVAGTPPNSSANCQLTSTTAGAKTLTATYTPSSTAFAASTDTEAHQVNAASTTLSVTGPARVRINNPATYTIALGVTSPGGGAPTGTVTVSEGSNSCTITLPQASCSLTFASLGSRSITATYAGNANYNGASSSGAGNATTVVFALSNVLVTKSDGDAFYEPGELQVYTIQLRNSGPDVARNLRLIDIVPSSLSGVQWTCDAAGGATCPQNAGTGNIDQAIAALPLPGLLNYTLAGTVIGNPNEISNTASVQLPIDNTIDDPTPSNNSATDIDQLRSLFRNGFETATVNAPSGSFTLPSAALRGALDSVAVSVLQLDDKQGTALRVYARVFDGELKYALAIRGSNGRLQLGSWQRYDNEPTLRWTAMRDGEAWVLQGATMQ